MSFVREVEDENFLICAIDMLYDLLNACCTDTFTQVRRIIMNVPVC